MDEDPIAAFIGEVVVLDTQGPMIYIGTLERIDAGIGGVGGAPTGGGFLVLVEADVHDTNDSRASKDLYLVETRELGVRVNRTRVIVMRGQVASVSLLREVVD